MEEYTKVQSVIQDHIERIVKKKDDLIMSILEKQKEFISLEKSKHLIEVNEMYKNEAHVGTDYLFNGKRFLTVFPVEFTEESGHYKAVSNYLEY